MNGVTTELRGDVLVAQITAGKIDGQTAPELQSQLLAAVDTASHAVIEVSQVTYMSSAGFRLLLLVFRTLNLRDGRVAIVGLSEEIRDTMDMTGFLDFFLLNETLELALGQLSNDAISNAGAR